LALCEGRYIESLALGVRHLVATMHYLNVEHCATCEYYQV